MDVGVDDGADDHLGDAHAWGDLEGGAAVVDEDDFDFAAIAFVDGAGAVEDGEAVLEGETAAGPDLGFGVGGEGDRNSSSHQRSLPRLNCHGFDGGEVHACITGMGVFRQSCVRVELLDLEIH